MSNNDMISFREYLLRTFPKLENDFLIIAGPSEDSNCISYSLGYVTFKVWPTVEGVGLVYYDETKKTKLFWPKNLSLSQSLSNFIKMYKIFKFEICNDDSFEEDYMKIAVFAKDDIVTHACRQLHTAENMWASKMGDEGAIKHRLYSLEGEAYGEVVCIMKRHISINKNEFRNIIEGK